MATQAPNPRAMDNVLGIKPIFVDVGSKNLPIEYLREIQRPALPKPRTVKADVTGYSRGSACCVLHVKTKAGEVFNAVMAAGDENVPKNGSIVSVEVTGEVARLSR